MLLVNSSVEQGPNIQSNKIKKDAYNVIKDVLERITKNKEYLRLYESII